MPERKPGSVFYVSILIVGLFVIMGFLWPDRLNEAATRALDFITRAFGWFYLMTAFVCLISAVVLMSGPFGRIRLGRDDEDPEYPFMTWLAMLFSAGMGIGLVFWGAAEPIFHYLSPPEGVTGGTAQAAHIALRYSYFHWGLQPWAIYSVIGLSLAYAHYRKGRSNLISSTLYPLIGERTNGAIGKSVDSLAIIATAFGIATSLGLGAMQINGGLNFLLNVPNRAGVQLIIIAAVTFLFILSASTGVNKGIRYLSNLNLGIAALLLLFVLVVGPTFFIVDAFTSTIGSYIGNLIPMSFRMTPFTQGTFVGTWTIFYWAWWISWGPFVGSFIARISRGRTVREFVMGVLIVPTLLSALWFAVFGGTSLYYEMFKHRGIADAVNEDVTSALFVLLQQLPAGGAISAIATVLIVTFFVTSADSATFVLGMLSSHGHPNPRLLTKLIWGLLSSGIAAVLLLSGGLTGVQTASITIALPFAVIMLLMVFATHRVLKEEVREYRLKEKRRLRKLEQLIENELIGSGES